MRRKAQNRLWTLILMLLLCGAGLAPAARVARAGTAPSDPVPGAPPSNPGAGDPDSPDTGRSLPAPGSHGGTAGQSTRLSTSQPSGWSIWMLRLRVIFASFYRTLFRI
jgi:hypothetical protein